jgi:hypothetical protein
VGGDGGFHLVAVLALGHDVEAVLRPEDTGHADPHDEGQPLTNCSRHSRRGT